MTTPKARKPDMTMIATQQFDYEALSESTKIVVQQKTSEIRSRMNKAASNIMEIGERLIAVKEQLGHGQFREWLTAEFAWDERSAQRMMKVATTFKSDNLSDLALAPSALYLLASDATPQEVKDRFVQKAQDGEQVTHAEVKQAVQVTRATPQVVSKAEYEGEIVDEETGEVFEDASRKRRKYGKGVILANKAIAVLQEIPTDDPLREVGLDTVAEWIEFNR